MNDYIDLEHLAVLDAIDRMGSFAAAAEKLHKAKSAVTYSIKQLEQSLHIEIFDRSGHRAILTKAGRALLADGRKLLASSRQLKAKVQNKDLDWPDKLRIAYDQALDSNRLYDAVDAFRKNHANTNLYLQSHALGGCWDALLHDKADIVLGASGLMPDQDRYHVSAMADLSFDFCVGVNHPLSQVEKNLSSDDINQYTMIYLMDSSRRLPEQNYDTYMMQRYIYVSQIEDKLELIIRGLAVGFLPSHIASQTQAGGRIVIKAVEQHRPKVTLAVACLSSRKKEASIAWWLNRFCRNCIDSF